MVRARYWQSLNISWNLNLLSGPKGTMTCGQCGCNSQHRLPLKDYPRIMCPSCNTVNVINIVYK